MDNIIVSVICKAYNHEKYIRKCLESLVSQKTTFEYEVIVHDDASTDKTVEVIKEFVNEYPTIIKPIYQKENQYSKNINTTIKYILPMCKGKYIALCEGDDFWTDNNKLQIQIDFLENNPDYVLCGHSAYYANESGTLSDKEYFAYGSGTRTIATEEIISGWVMATNSMVYKLDARGINPIPYKGEAFNGDYALMTYLSLQGKVFFIDKLMSA